MSVTLKEFLSGLATDCQKFAQFVSDPAAVVGSAGLSPEDAAILKSGNAAAIQARVGNLSGGPGDSNCHCVVWASGAPGQQAPAGTQAPFMGSPMPFPMQGGPAPMMFLVGVWPIGQSAYPASPPSWFPFPWAAPRVG